LTGNSEERRVAVERVWKEVGAEVLERSRQVKDAVRDDEDFDMTPDSEVASPWVAAEATMTAFDALLEVIEAARADHAAGRDVEVRREALATALAGLDEQRKGLKRSLMVLGAAHVRREPTEWVGDKDAPTADSVPECIMRRANTAQSRWWLMGGS